RPAKRPKLMEQPRYRRDHPDHDAWSPGHPGQQERRIIEYRPGQGDRGVRMHEESEQTQPQHLGEYSHGEERAVLAPPPAGAAEGPGSVELEIPQIRHEE